MVLGILFWWNLTNREGILIIFRSNFDLLKLASTFSTTENSLTQLMKPSGLFWYCTPHRIISYILAIDSIVTRTQLSSSITQSFAINFNILLTQENSRLEFNFLHKNFWSENSTIKLDRVINTVELLHGMAGFIGGRWQFSQVSKQDCLDQDTSKLSRFTSNSGATGNQSQLSNRQNISLSSSFIHHKMYTLTTKQRDVKFRFK